ncbi:MAG: inorganic diphosphatase [Methylocella sp.]
MLFDAFPPGLNPPREGNGLVEVPIRSQPIKYEFDTKVSWLSTGSSARYGFIRHTLSDEDDPCDVIVANTRAIGPGAGEPLG